jgi:hypothetical protein
MVISHMFNFLDFLGMHSHLKCSVVALVHDDVASLFASGVTLVLAFVISICFFFKINCIILINIFFN